MDQSAVLVTPPYRRDWRLAALLCAATAVLWLLIAPVAGYAQCLLCAASDTPADAIAIRGPDEVPLTVTVTADLDFSRLVAGNAGGTVTLDPASGGSVARGDVAAIGGFGFGGRVSVTGTPGRSVRITMPDSVVLTSTSGRTAHVRDLVTSLPPLARIGADGRLDFAFGGRLEVDGGADGSYNGRVAITVSYD